MHWIILPPIQKKKKRKGTLSPKNDGKKNYESDISFKIDAKAEKSASNLGSASKSEMEAKRILEPEASDIEERKKEQLQSSKQSVAPKNPKKGVNGEKKSKKLCHSNSDGDDPVMTRQSSYQAWAASGWGLGAVGCGVLVSSTSTDTILYLYDACMCLEWLLLVALLFMFSLSLVNPTIAFEPLPPPPLLPFPMGRDGRCELQKDTAKHKYQPNKIHASHLATHLIGKRPFKKSMDVSTTIVTFGVLTPQQSIVRTTPPIVTTVPGGGGGGGSGASSSHYDPLLSSKVKRSNIQDGATGPDTSHSNLLEIKVQRALPYSNKQEMSDSASVSTEKDERVSHSPSALTSRSFTPFLSWTGFNSIPSYDSRTSHNKFFQRYFFFFFFFTYT
ncbi:hypothetical protein RFI_06016 [Reticulomyxa filosa]|uniref:Uncharacterized protein n=1 Tax=Reticulomyxa filosa TaxID=46433 RepID=X6NZ35_RETFI|nr:hypothetical protein RFI_06016 [Reticulomyxa filosa]|eukprot:ETO31104.1 hypothetical protein RFI_06016 [Reticulomyxa filosa]